MNEFNAFYDSKIGLLEITSTEKEITSINFVSRKFKASKHIPTCLKNCLLQLNEFFSGKRKVFSIPLTLSGTKFQKRVWTELQRISFGETISYKGLAKKIGNPKAVRAVASACKQNSLPVLIPCHRIIASNGKIGSYFGGVKKKKWLLEFEKCIE